MKNSRLASAGICLFVLAGMICMALNDTDASSNQTEQAEESGISETKEKEVSFDDPEDIEDYLWVYDGGWALIEDYERYDEERELPYIDDETFAVIKAAYEEIDFNGEFETGDPEIYDEYRWKFWELLHGRGIIWDQETGKELTILEFLEESFYFDEYDPAKQYYIYYFYDMDGDGCPELGIWETEALYFLRYNKELDRFSVWYKMGGWYHPIGTRKGMCSPNLGNHNSYDLLDENADIECSIYFFHEYESRKDDLYMVMLPDYADKGWEVEVTQKMKAQGAYVRSFEQWFFRVTEEQYDELTDPYYEAYWKGHHEREEVQYSYDELFGDFIQAESQGKEESVPNEAVDSITEDKNYEEVSGFRLNDLGEAVEFIDYEFIQENHEILEYNICTSPRYDYADTILAEYLQETVKDAERLRELGVSNPITIDYFTYDLNADGLEDYIVCESGVYCTGSAGDHLEIYVQEEEGTLREIFGLTIPLHLPEVSGLPGGHAPIAVLNEMVNGYYVLVLSENCDIVRYDANRECYDFEFPISDLGKAADFIDYESIIPRLCGIRKYNICTRSRNDYADTILAECLQEEVEEAERVTGSSDPVTIEYFLYDFNADGLEDYLVCMSGALWSDENDGNEVRIYVQEKGQTVRMVFRGTVPLHLPDIPGLRGGHAPIAVLSGRINDYHILVLPGSRILKYDSDSDRYQYDDYEF